MARTRRPYVRRGSVDRAGDGCVEREDLRPQLARAAGRLDRGELAVLGGRAGDDLVDPVRGRRRGRRRCCARTSCRRRAGSPGARSARRSRARPRRRRPRCPPGPRSARGEKPARGRPGAGRATIVSPSRSPSRPRRLPEARNTARPIGPSSTIRVDVRRATAFAVAGRRRASARARRAGACRASGPTAPRRGRSRGARPRRSRPTARTPSPRIGMRNGAPTNTPSTARAIARRESYFERSSCGGAAAARVSACGASTVVLIPPAIGGPGAGLELRRAGRRRP